MTSASPSPRVHAGTGLQAGDARWIVVGLVAWVVSGEVTVGLIRLVATGTASGVAFERSLDARPLTLQERRRVLIPGTAGTVVGILVFRYVALSR